MYALLLLGSVVFLDLVLSGDNAVVIGMAANRLPRRQRNFALAIGMLAAAVMRILFALIAVTLLAHHIIAFFGGLALLYVAYKLARDTISPQEEIARTHFAIQFIKAAGLILIADISMSLDNILSVAALARNHVVIMVVGFALSIAFVTILATWVADLLDRYKWLNWVGIVLIGWVAIDLIVGNFDQTLALIRS